MNIPEEVMSLFVKEAENTKYGKVSLGIIRRGRHERYEIDKHITIITKDDEVVSEQENKAT